MTLRPENKDQFNRIIQPARSLLPGRIKVMLTKYIYEAMRRAKYEIWADDGTFYGEIPGFEGVYATVSALEECKVELEEVLKEWSLFRVSKNLPLPTAGGIELSIKDVA